ncbi:Smg-4/UPF3 family-domain-containing protein [Gautieria morchelliformis]|nr:Smg-4/UPF3 family-domain-containing protein [Gautieria morchelliformis]
MTTKSPSLPNRGRTRSPTQDNSKQQSAAPIRLKTVVRRLPPNLPESVFWQSVEPWVTDETASWRTFYQGKLRKKLNKENIPSRAYVLFKQEEHLAAFSREYDGHVFRDKQGNESQAVVEFAPNQKAPPEKKKVDSRHATIQQDEDYLSFMASLQNPSTKSVEVDVDALLASTLPPEQPKTTPLLAALREQKHSAQEKKLATSETAKSQSRKGGAAALPAQKQEVADSAPATGKKGKKGKAPQASGTPPSAPPVTNPTPAKASSGGSRNRPNASQASGPSTTSSAVSSATAPAGKAVVPPVGEQTQRKTRPILGLQSRHLKAALSGAGMQVASATPMSPSSSSALTAPTPNASVGAAVGPSSSAPRGPRGRGAGEQRNHEQNKDGTSKDAGGGRGSGKEKARSRHTSGLAHSGTGSRIPDATPRILSRQDPPPPHLIVNEPPPKDRASTSGSQEPGGSRGRGGRRGRGQ